MQSNSKIPGSAKLIFAAILADQDGNRLTVRFLDTEINNFPKTQAAAESFHPGYSVCCLFGWSRRTGNWAGRFGQIPRKLLPGENLELYLAVVVLDKCHIFGRFNNDADQTVMLNT